MNFITTALRGREVYGWLLLFYRETYLAAVVESCGTVGNGGSYDTSGSFVSLGLSGKDVERWTRFVEYVG
jgi:hypothetical protein